MKPLTSRRAALKTGCAAGIAGAMYSANFGRGIQAAVNNMSLHSSPSDLKITDMKWGLSYGIGYELYVKIYTNQDITGLGTGTDPAGNAGFNMFRRFKGRLVGQNPLDVNRLFETIRQAGHCFGGPDMNVLYITCGNAVYSVQTHVISKTYAVDGGHATP
jgi:galactonate dehydratase